jgi:hypothetical protein
MTKITRRAHDLIPPDFLTATHVFNIVGRGGVSDSIKLVERFRNGELIARDFGTCQLP